MKNKATFSSAFFLLLLLIFLTEPATKNFHKNIFRLIEETYLESLFILLIASVFSLFIGFFLSSSIYKKWFNKFFVWYLPSAYALTFLFPVTGYTMIYRYDAAVILSVGMVLVTVAVLIKDKVLPSK